MLRGEDSPLPTKTPVGEIVEEYVNHIRAVKTPKSAQTDIYYLREVFGEVCEGLKCTSRKRTEKTRKRKLKPGMDGRNYRRPLKYLTLSKSTPRWYPALSLHWFRHED